MRRGVFFLFFFLSAAGVSAQDSYIFQYLKGDLSPNSSRIVMENFGDGVMSVVAAFPEQYHPQSLVVNYHDHAGKLHWSKRYRFSYDVQPTAGIVVDDKFYVLGLKSRSSGSGYSDYTGFFAVIDEKGDLEHFEETNFAGGVEFFGNLIYDSSSETFLSSGLIQETPGAGTLWQAIFEFDKQGQLIQVKRLFESYSSGQLAQVAGQGTYLFDGTTCVLLDSKENPISAQKFPTTTQTYRPYLFVPLGGDSMLVFSQEYIFANNAYRYSIAVWNTQSNEFRTRLSSDVMGFTKCIATGTGFLLTANTGNNFYVYELDQNLNVVRSVGHQFASSVYIYFNATQVCDNELLAMCANATGNYLEVIKSEKGWQFLGTSIGCPVLHPTDSVATMVADNGVNYQNSTLNFSGIIPTVNNSDLGIVATVVASNTNCELVDIVQDTLLACNQPNVVLQPTEAFRTCLPTDAVRSYSWSDGASQLDHTVSASGWYKVVINEDVCQDEDSIYVRLEQAAVRITGDARFCAGNGEEARFTANSSSGELTWGPVFSDQKTYETTTEGKVFVQVITPAGCIASDTIFAEEVCEPLVYFPSAFTPDGDGINDHYSASILYATNSDLKIYNRWGELVYETTDSTVNWDGTFRGADSGQGIYVWQLHYTSEVTHEKVMQRGSFNLVR